MKLQLKPRQYKWIRRGLWARGREDGRIAYGISYNHNGKRIRETIGPSQSQAEKVLHIRQAEIAQGRYELSRMRERAPTLKEFSVEYLEWAKENKASWQTDDQRLRCGLLPILGNESLDDITPRILEHYKSERRKSVSPRTVNMEIGLLRHLYNLARKWDVADENPVSSVRFFPAGEREYRVLSREEEKLLLEVAPDHLRGIILVALNTGLAKSELLRLQRKHVNLKEGYIRIQRKKVRHIVRIPLNETASEAIRRGLSTGGEHVFTWEGGPIGSFKTAWYQSLRRAGIEGLRFHDLRHTFADRLVHAGVDIRTVQELMGHKTLAMTMRYTHPAPEHKRAAVEKLQI